MCFFPFHHNCYLNSPRLQQEWKVLSWPLHQLSPCVPWPCLQLCFALPILIPHCVFTLPGSYCNNCTSSIISVSSLPPLWSSLSNSFLELKPLTSHGSLYFSQPLFTIHAPLRVLTSPEWNSGAIVMGSPEYTPSTPLTPSIAVT